MKTVITLLLSFQFGAIWAQGSYLLEPVDSPGTIIIDEIPLLKKISEQKIKVNKVNRFDGYRVEIFQTSNRAEAKEVLDKFKEEHTNVPAEMVFASAYVKIKVGIYRSKLEAQKMLIEMKDEYPSSKIVYVKGLPFPPIYQEENDNSEE